MYNEKKVNEIRIRRMESISEGNQKVILEKIREMPGDFKFRGWVQIDLNGKGDVIGIKPISGSPADEFRRIMKGVEPAVF